jgi:hypothetical protein
MWSYSSGQSGSVAGGRRRRKQHKDDDPAARAREEREMPREGMIVSIRDDGKRFGANICHRHHHPPPPKTPLAQLQLHRVQFV